MNYSIYNQDNKAKEYQTQKGSSLKVVYFFSLVKNKNTFRFVLSLSIPKS